MISPAVRRPNRRTVLAAIAALPASLALARMPQALEANTTLGYRGVVYDTGTDIGYDGYLSRLSWHEADVRREIASIAQDLHCNTIQIVGTQIERLELAGRIALENELGIWLQPRIFEVSAAEQLAHMAEGAEVASRLQRDGGTVVFSVGCETSLFQHGIVPGATFSERLGPLLSATQDDARVISEKLDDYLSDASALARQTFSGPITYSAGSWERVDWRPFDIVGINLYRDSRNRERYREALRSYMAHDKPVVVTEFGASTFEGAGDYGAGGFQIVDYTTVPPSIPEQFVRSEEAQAREIVEILQILEEEGAAGAFVYNFLSQFDVHTDDPRTDLDTASHAITKVAAGAEDAPLQWEPKQAFGAIAAYYSDRLDRAP